MQLRCTAHKVGLRFGLQRQGKPDLVVVQMLNSSGTEAVFELHNISTIDSGNYSCIYMEQAPPFSGSASSEPLELRINGELRRTMTVEGTERYSLRNQGSCAVISQLYLNEVLGFENLEEISLRCETWKSGLFRIL